MEHRRVFRLACERISVDRFDSDIGIVLTEIDPGKIDSLQLLRSETSAVWALGRSPGDSQLGTALLLDNACKLRFKTAKTRGSLNTDGSKSEIQRAAAVGPDLHTCVCITVSLQKLF